MAADPVQHHVVSQGEGDALGQILHERVQGATTLFGLGQGRLQRPLGLLALRYVADQPTEKDRFVGRGQHRGDGQGRLQHLTRAPLQAHLPTAGHACRAGAQLRQLPQQRGTVGFGHVIVQAAAGQAVLGGAQERRCSPVRLPHEAVQVGDQVGIGSQVEQLREPLALGLQRPACLQQLLVLLAHYELTGETASLDSARRAADLTLSTYGPRRPHFGRRSTLSDRTGQTHGLCFADALEALYEVTGDDRYKDFARWMLDDFDAWPVPFPNDDLAATNVADPTRPLHGHAVHTVEHLRALAFGGAPDPARLQAALRKLRASATTSGAVIGDESLHGLPGPGAGYEYCTLTELTFSLARLVQHLGDPGLAGWMERLVFNAAQGARTADGRALAYLCSDTRLDALASRPDSYSLLSGRHGRFKLSPTHDDVACCCNPNATRLLPHYVAAMWMRCADGPALAALTYGPSELRTVVDGHQVVIQQDTAYPFEDEIRFTVTVAAPMQMRVLLRRPGWAAAVRVEGAAYLEQDGWISIDGTWRGSTSFVLQFDVPVIAERYPGGEVAVLRGPLQFVQPVPHRSRVLRAYPCAPWCDEELLPADPEDIAARLPVLECSQRDLGLAVMRDAGGDPDDPWSDPPLRLAGGGFVLVPIGAAPLRRAAFISRSGT